MPPKNEQQLRAENDRLKAALATTRAALMAAEVDCLRLELRLNGLAAGQPNAGEFSEREGGE